MSQIRLNEPKLHNDREKEEEEKKRNRGGKDNVWILKESKEERGKGR